MAMLLCIDDQESSLRIRKMFLEAQGHTVLTATEGRCGLQLLAANPVDMLILDYRMPGMSGEEVAREARRTRPTLPIILLSGYMHDLPESLRSLADALITKGAPPTELLGAIARFVGPAAKTPQANTPQDLLQASRGQARRSREQVQANVRRLERRRSPRG